MKSAAAATSGTILNGNRTPPMTFSPDADFPVINLEKGGLHMTLEAEILQQPEGIRLVSAQAGTKVNVVPGKARAVLSGWTGLPCQSFPPMWKS